MEHFFTIQGEGFYTGTPAYFIRLAGCDVGCHWCDVKESWPLAGHPRLSVEKLMEFVRQSGANVVVVTGGEPAMHNLIPLTTALEKEGKRAHIETSGSSPLTGKWDWITLSPKKFKAPLSELYYLADELKVVAYNKSDFDFALNNAAKVIDSCLLFIQPEWGKRDQMLPEIVGFVKLNPNWRISLQTHKYINVP